MSETIFNLSIGIKEKLNNENLTPVKYWRTDAGIYQLIKTTNSSSCNCLFIAQIANGEELLNNVEIIVKNTVSPEDPWVVVAVDEAKPEDISVQVSFVVISPINLLYYKI